MSLAQVYTKALGVCGTGPVARMNIDETVAEATRLLGITPAASKNEVRSVAQIVQDEEATYGRLVEELQRLIDQTGGSVVLVK